MQSKASRIALLVVAAAIAVAAFLVLRPSDEEEQRTTASQEAGQGAASGEGESSGSDGDRDTDAEGGEANEPPVPTIEFENGEPVGGPAEIEAQSGERIEFVVTSDTPDELHVHGYELTKPVAPDEPARFSFVADLEGVFEVEMHDAGHVPVAELRVTP